MKDTASTSNIIFLYKICYMYIPKITEKITACIQLYEEVYPSK